MSCTDCEDETVNGRCISCFSDVIENATNINFPYLSHQQGKQMKVTHNHQTWEVVKTIKSISNGSRQYILKRDSDGLVTVKNCGECERIKDGGIHALQTP